MFYKTKELMLERAPQMSDTLRAEEEAYKKELRSDLDRVLEWQADDAPEALIEASIREGLFPQREGSMMDTLYTRQHFAQDEDDDVEMEDNDELEIAEDVHAAEKEVFGGENGMLDYTTEGMEALKLELEQENKPEEENSDENKSDEKKPVKAEEERGKGRMGVASPTKKHLDTNTPSTLHKKEPS